MISVPTEGDLLLERLFWEDFLNSITVTIASSGSGSGRVVDPTEPNQAELDAGHLRTPFLCVRRGGGRSGGKRTYGDVSSVVG